MGYLLTNQTCPICGHSMKRRLTKPPAGVFICTHVHTRKMIDKFLAEGHSQSLEEAGF